MTSQESVLPYLNDRERKAAYDLIVAGCHHLWSKNKLDETKLDRVLGLFGDLAEKDPLFLAHLTSWVMKNSDSRDLKVLTIFANSLSDADGTPFSKGSKYCKPNWRSVSQAALQELEPKLVLRVLHLALRKGKFGSRTEGTHYSKTLKTAAKKYLKYREEHSYILKGIREKGLRKVASNLYRLTRSAPSKNAVEILGWEQTPGFPGSGAVLQKNVIDFSGLTDLQIAEKIREERIPVMTALGALGTAATKLSPVVAVSLLERCTPSQAVVYTGLFEDQGLLEHAEIRDLYKTKIAGAKTLDRADRMNQVKSEEVKKIMRAARSEERKRAVGDLGKVFEHIDISSSMHRGLQLAKDRSAVIAECVQNPEVNFHWGVFADSGRVLQKPTTFEKDAFTQILYPFKTGGCTNCFALYEEARRLGCTTDVFITDQGHNYGTVAQHINKARSKGYPDPELVVIVDTNENDYGFLKEGFESAGIPVAMLKPSALNESALVAEAIRHGIKGTSKVLEEIMSTTLLELPNWWDAISTKTTVDRNLFSA